MAKKVKITKEDKDGNFIDSLNRNRRTDIEVEGLVMEAIEKILYDNVSYTEFKLKFGFEHNISVRYAEKIWHKAKERIKERNDDTIDEIFETQVNRYLDLLKRAREDKNKRIEREVLADLNKLYGIGGKRLDITSNGEPIQIKINLDND